MILPINRNWRFNKSIVEGAHAREFDDPPSNALSFLTPTSASPGTASTIDVRVRLHLSPPFKLPPEAAGHHVFVDSKGS